MVLNGSQAGYREIVSVIPLLVCSKPSSSFLSWTGSSCVHNEAVIPSHLPFSNWTTAYLADYLAQQTDITISSRQVETYLKAHGWRLRRPVRSVKHKQDPELVEEGKKPDH